MSKEKETIRNQWNYASDSWNDFVENKKDFGKRIIHPGIVKLLPPRENGIERALDLCCGEGYYSRILKEMNYEVSGVDISDKQIEFARSKNKDIHYFQGDAANLHMLENGSFDLVLCSMGLIDTPDLNGSLSEINRVLKRGKYLVASITHPCFDRPMVGNWIRDEQGNKTGFSIDNYSVEDSMVYTWEMKRLKFPFDTLTYHRTLATYLNAMIANNLQIDEILEPYEDMDGKMDQEEFRVPNFLIIRCRKGTARKAKCSNS